MSDFYQSRFNAKPLNDFGSSSVSKRSTGEVGRSYRVHVNDGDIFGITRQLVSLALPYDPNIYNHLKSFYLSRGSSDIHSEAMTAITHEISSVTGVDHITVLEGIENLGKFSIPEHILDTFNKTRENTSQVSYGEIAKNKDSLVARKIRS